MLIFQIEIYCQSPTSVAGRNPVNLGDQNIPMYYKSNSFTNIYMIEFEISYNFGQVSASSLKPQIQTMLIKLRPNLIKLHPKAKGQYYGYVSHEGIKYSCDKIYITSPALHLVWGNRYTIE